MAACLNGLALHGGARPIGLGELQDSHAIGPTLRLASRHHWPVIHMLVEPTEHCPAAGQRAALRSIQNVTVFRPAEACEALACGELALRAATSPSVLLLSDTPQPRLSAKIPRAGCAQGAYVVREPAGPRDLTLIASGPELAIALAAEADLRADGLACAVVSLPCWDFFSAQPRLTRARILGQALRVGIETGSGFGWERWLGEDGVFVGSEACAQGIPVTAAMVAAAARRGLRGRIATA
jgi:transketolase